MNWKSYLRVQTRNPQFLWRFVLAILASGGIAAIGAHLLVYEPPPEIAVDGLTNGAPPDRPPPDPQSMTLAKLREAQAAHDWWKVWWLIPQVVWGGVHVGPAIIAVLTALFWLLFVLQTGQAESPRSARFWLCLMAIPLGVLSTWPTLFVGSWQEEMWNLSLEDEDGLEGFGSALRFFVVGVGLREEVIKLAFFVPLLPVVVVRRNELERLVVASCVGLGFAAKENISYFGSTASASVARYLTANFWHLASTGLLGLWLCRAIRWPKECLPQFLAYFGLIVVGHGIYDAFIGAGDYAIVSSLVFLALAYAYFHEVRELRPRRNEAISLTANFAIGVSLLAAITFAFVTAHLGLRGAGREFLQPAIAASLMAYVFLREVPESLVRT